MPLTRTQDTAALKYSVERVLNQPVDGPIMKSLANLGIDFVSDLASLRDVDILTMTYSTDEDVGTLLALSLPLRGRLTAFCALMRYRVIQSLPIGDNWTSITREEFDEFRINPVYDGTIHGMISTSNLNIPATPFVSTMPLTRTQDAAALRHTSDPKATIQRLDPLGGETYTPIIKSLHDSNETGIDSNDGETKEYQHMPVAGKSLLIDPQEDGQHCRISIVRAIEDRDGETADTPTRTELLCSSNDDASEKIEILSHIESDESEGTSVLKFKRITAHESPLIRTSPDWKGSSYNVTMEWENGTSTSESLAVIAATDPIICAIYAQDKDLLEVDGWKRFKVISSRQGKLLRMVNQLKLHSYHTAPKYHHGDGVPKDYQHAVRLDEHAGNTKWQDSTKQKMFQLDDYDTFNDYGHSGRSPGKYKIRVHPFSSGTLVDRGANNGFAGADARQFVDRGIRWPFHRVREAITTKIIAFYHDAFEDIAADIVAFYHATLSILWDYQQVWKLLRPPVF
jgi:hypothetical protein